MTHVECVARTGVVDVVARIVGHQSIVAGVVDALERQGRPHLVAFGRVVVDHIEDHLQPGLVKARDHDLELADRLTRHVARMGGKEAKSVVAPVIAQAFFQQVVVIEEVMHGHQFHGGHAE
ncbi:hypothetical protein D3C73_728670 [compost metagenome]